MPVFNERAQGSFKEMGGGIEKLHIYLIYLEKDYFLKAQKTWGGPQEQKEALTFAAKELTAQKIHNYICILNSNNVLSIHRFEYKYVFYLNSWLAWPHSLNCSRFAHCPVFGFSKLEKWTGQSLENINQVIILTPIYKLVKSWMLKVWQICLTWRFYVVHVNTKLHTIEATLSNQNKIESTIRNKSQTFNFGCKVSINTV